jgi:hypothetical protein
MEQKTEQQKINEFNRLISEYATDISGYDHSSGTYGHYTLMKRFDTELRLCIGKTDDIRIALCSHQAIINREFPNYFCRVCNTDLSVEGKGRFNDFLILRHPQCTKPICLDCAKNRPDIFFIAFQKGLKKYEEMSDPDRILTHFIEDIKEFSQQLNFGELNSSQP